MVIFLSVPAQKATTSSPPHSYAEPRRPECSTLSSEECFPVGCRLMLRSLWTTSPRSGVSSCCCLWQFSTVSGGCTIKYNRSRLYCPYISLSLSLSLSPYCRTTHDSAASSWRFLLRRNSKLHTLRRKHWRHRRHALPVSDMCTEVRRFEQRGHYGACTIIVSDGPWAQGGQRDCAPQLGPCVEV